MSRLVLIYLFIYLVLSCSARMLKRSPTPRRPPGQSSPLAARQHHENATVEKNKKNLGPLLPWKQDPFRESRESWKKKNASTFLVVCRHQ